MNSEPKSIFTSKKDFESDWGKPLPEQRSPQTTQNPTAPPSIAAHPATHIEKTAKEAESIGDAEENILDVPVRRAADAGLGKRSRGDSVGRRTEIQFRDTFTSNASPRNSTLGSLAIFRKPNLPASPPQSATRTEVVDTTNASKHGRVEDRRPSTERPTKRTRPKLKPRHRLDPDTFERAIHKRSTAEPPSPLFFSHSPRQRPILPPTYSTTDGLAAMMNKARDEPGGFTTLKLARGSISNASPPRSSSTPGSSWTASSGKSQTPDLRSRSASGLSMLASVGVVELLEQDERPTFIVDISNSMNYIPGGNLQLLFANPALRAYDSILDMVTGKADLDTPGMAVTNDFPAFKQWILSFVKNGESLDISLPSFLYGGITWTCSTLRKRLRLISGTAGGVAMTTSSTSNLGISPLDSERAIRRETSRLPKSPLAESNEPVDYFGNALVPAPVSTASTSPTIPISASNHGDDYEEGTLPEPLMPSQSDSLTTSMMQTRYHESSCFDWTRLPMSAALPKHIQFVRSIDWASTPLGPIETWSYDLRSMCNLVMGSPHPAAMYWGDEYIAIYNEAYILLAGQKHPNLMGQSYKVAWAEIWPEIEGIFTNAKDLGQATMKDDDCLFLRRNGYLEESYFSWSIVPLVGQDGSVVGLYNPAFEKTRRKIAERRMLTLREVGEKTAAARDVRGFWGQVIKGLQYNEYDVPFVFLYSVSEETDSDMSSINSGSLGLAPQCVLEGTLGVPKNHRATISPLDLKTSEHGFAPYLRESMKTDRPVLLTTEDGTLSYDLIEGLEWRGFGDPCRAAVVCPIHSTGDTILGFLVMGVNPRRPYDDDYSLFIQLLSRQLTTSIASVILFEEEIKRGQRAARLAALDRQELSKQLDLRTQEAVESEQKFTRMAEFAPVGMFIANSEGQITYSNDQWWMISRHPRSDNSTDTWMDSIMDADRARVEDIWTTIVAKKTAVTHEFRFKTPWQDRTGSRGDTWVLMSAYPEKDEHGALKSVFGSITNISQQKWAEDFQKRRMEEAIELKRQQENFIDMTSHEMRNPLSAILQCSDEITTSLSEFKAAAVTPSIKLVETLDSSIDAAQTIALCAQHQKRIVDDVLTLSKLDSALLMVTPVAVQPVAVVQRALKMFEGELDTNDIAMEFKMEKSYLDLEIDWVKLDPSRLLQVLINLTTNAIKFTHSSGERTIIVSIGASIEPPGDHNVSYFPSRSKRKNLVTEDADWGDGEEVYLHFAVQDTGRGLDSKEMTLLFQRFSQASPRTHVQYGGSGLGLFISRELTELQGGEIGVSSEKGIGSTFAFYIKARRIEDYAPDTPISSALNSIRRDSGQSATVTIESRRNSSGKAIQRAGGTGARRPSRIITPPITEKAPPTPTPSSSLDHGTLKILIVEDNLVNQRVLQKQLVNLGFQTSLANHGGEALDFLRTSKFWYGHETSGVELAVILMDLEMPVMDGLTCARKIRDFEADGTISRHVPIIAVTANARLEQIETAINAGMDDVVSKPFRTAELIPKIDELVLKSRDTWTTPATTTATTTVTANLDTGVL